ncbi:unnamed protein product [Ixodes pacificus]
MFWSGHHYPKCLIMRSLIIMFQSSSKISLSSSDGNCRAQEKSRSSRQSGDSASDGNTRTAGRSTWKGDGKPAARGRATEKVDEGCAGTPTGNEVGISTTAFTFAARLRFMCALKW